MNPLEGNVCLWKAKKTPGSSWAWESILEGRDLLLRHGLWQIGDGRGVRIFKDKWIEKEPILRTHTCLEENATINDLMCKNHRSWDIHKILNNFTKNTAAKIIATPYCQEMSQMNSYSHTQKMVTMMLSLVPMLKRPKEGCWTQQIALPLIQQKMTCGSRFGMLR